MFAEGVAEDVHREVRVPYAVKIESSSRLRHYIVSFNVVKLGPEALLRQ